MIPEWLPNWRNVAAYPEPDGLYCRGWAWEFLRRNPEYQKDFIELQNYLDECAYDAKIAASSDTPVNTFWICDPPAMPSENEKSYMDRMADFDGPVIMTPAWRWFAEKWGLNRLQEPAVPHTQTLRFEQGGAVAVTGKYTRMSGHSRANMRLKSDFEMWIKFDLSQPLEAQIKAAKRRLYARKPFVRPGPQPRHHKVKFPTYLRLLDAEIAGASLEEAAALIYPEASNQYPDYVAVKTAREALKAAHGYRDNGYRALAASGA